MAHEKLTGGISDPGIVILRRILPVETVKQPPQLFIVLAEIRKGLYLHHIDPRPGLCLEIENSEDEPSTLAS